MFSGKKIKKEDNQKDEQVELKERLDQELLVHNMPNLRKQEELARESLGVKSSDEFISGTTLKLEPEKSNHRQVGLIIVSLGIVFILILAYLGYLFIIKPTLKNNETIKKNEPQVIVSEIEGLKEIEITEIGKIEESEPIMIEIEKEEEEEENFDEERMPEEGSLLEEVDFLPLIDSDNDGLFDEEELVLGTNPNNTDTNENTYPDLLEVLNNYNPAGEGRLENNEQLTWYRDNVFNYSLLYPKDWEFSVLSGNQVLIFELPDNSLAQLSIQSNSEKIGIIDWYRDFFPDEIISYNQVKMTDTWEGIEGGDGFNVYLTDNNQENIYTFSYIPVSSNRIAYPNIFKLIVDSLVIN